MRTVRFLALALCLAILAIFANFAESAPKSVAGRAIVRAGVARAAVVQNQNAFYNRSFFFRNFAFQNFAYQNYATPIIVAPAAVVAAPVVVPAEAVVPQAAYAPQAAFVPQYQSGCAAAALIGQSIGYSPFSAIGYGVGHSNYGFGRAIFRQRAFIR